MFNLLSVDEEGNILVGILVDTERKNVLYQLAEGMHNVFSVALPSVSDCNSVDHVSSTTGAFFLLRIVKPVDTAPDISIDRLHALLETTLLLKFPEIRKYILKLTLIGSLSSSSS